jgi:hypothetical protein
VPVADVKTLRKETSEYIAKFDANLWHEKPITTLLFGSELSSGDRVTTVDAFNRVNGKQILAAKHEVDLVIGHIHNYQPPRKDLRAEVRAMDWRFMTIAAPTIVGNQAIDFEKQDGITEIDEAIQANCVEQRLTDALFAAEANGEVDIRRTPCFVACVSNFSNFLDLSRKVLRQIEVGVPVVVLSRSNTTQHMYRWAVLLIDMLREFNVDLGMVTYVSCSIDEQRRMFSACPQCPNHFTGSREIAKRIKEVCPGLIASTGGPNTLVATEYNDAVGDAVRWSSLIENSGQCTALRHFVCPGVDKSMLETMFAKSAKCVTGAKQSIDEGEFAGIFDFTPEQAPVAGYQTLNVQKKCSVKISPNLPVEINEMWRQIYIDVTTPSVLADDKFLATLSRWLNYEQPITLAINANNYDIATKLFETTGLCVYTVGTLDKPALTAQARPQDGEVFGEFPPRRMMSEVTKLPMLNPTPCAGYNAVYNDEYLKKRVHNTSSNGLHGLHQDATRLLAAIQDDRIRGYACTIMDYLLDACEPKEGLGSRSTLFGLQRPPLDGSMTILRCNAACNFDLLLLHAAPFCATNAHDSLDISLAPSSRTAALQETLRGTFNVNVEDHRSYQERKKSLHVYNDVCVDDPIEMLLAFQFVSKLFPLGHIKSSQGGDHKFLAHFKNSKKWLRTRVMTQYEPILKRRFDHISK